MHNNPLLFSFHTLLVVAGDFAKTRIITMRKRKRAMEPSKQKQKQNQRIQKGGQQKQTLILIHFHM